MHRLDFINHEIRIMQIVSNPHGVQLDHVYLVVRPTHHIFICRDSLSQRFNLRGQ
jgi:hypothetical protein